MDDIEKYQYKNLRKCFNENLVEPILGKDYYNMAMDVYNADIETTRDLKSKFDDMNVEAKFYKVLLIVSLILNALIIAFILV